MNPAMMSRVSTALSACLLLLASCSARGQDETIGGLVDVGSFTINVLDLDDWDVTIDREKGTAEFSQGKQQLLSLFSNGAGGATSILVFKNRPQGREPGLWLMTEREMANHFRAMETAGLHHQPQMVVVKVDTDAVFIEGRQYYRLLYTARFGRGESESVLHLYFPPEFSRTKEFFGFLIAESYVANSIFASKNLDQIKPILLSLRTAGSESVLPGVEGELLWAATEGDSSRVRALVENGADVNALPKNGRGPLSLAALYGHESIARYLVDRGASVNPEKVQEVYAPLASAMLGRETRLAEYLLTRGAHAKARPDDQLPPLARAICMHLDTGLVSLLLASGAEPNQCRTWTPIMHAANEGQTLVVELLLDHGAVVDGAGTDGQTALMLALQNNHPDISALLLAHGANPNAASNDGTSPLMCAALGDDTTSMARLLEGGARVQASRKTGETALALAALEGHAACARILLKHGSAVDAPNSSGITPIAYAIAGRNVECAGLLLEYGADINARTHQGITPLMIAALQGDSIAVQFLIDRGADLEIECETGDTALDLADKRDFDSIVVMLEKAAEKK